MRYPPNPSSLDSLAHQLSSFQSKQHFDLKAQSGQFARIRQLLAALPQCQELEERVILLEREWGRAEKWQEESEAGLGGLLAEVGQALAEGRGGGVGGEGMGKEGERLSGKMSVDTMCSGSGACSEMENDSAMLRK